jgi:hypothetical protein
MMFPQVIKPQHEDAVPISTDGKTVEKKEIASIDNKDVVIEQESIDVEVTII